MHELERVREQLAPIADQLAGALIAVDFDGTLAPIVQRPEDAVALPDAVAALRDLAPRVGCLAVITGRPVEFVAHQLTLDTQPFPVVLRGAYGREHWQNGEVRQPPPPDEVRAAAADLAALLATAPAGVLLEDKGSGVAVHTRQAVDPAGALGLLDEPVRAVAARHGLHVEPGRYVLEVRPFGIDKGTALLDLVREHQPQAVLFVGDDLGDLAAFEVVEQLRERGLAGVTVCAGSAEVPTLAERADLVVDGPAGVAVLLSELVRLAAG
ncbi:MAG: trehalose 6-phosphate phosphatase [Frankiales bacterium]|nr:trehalose 6-phosphate phosphatase [Frankiales bacterium]